MPKKLYLCPVVGDGSEANPHRLKVADYYGKHVAVMPVSGWGIALVSDAEHAASLADPDVYPFPADPSTLFSALSADHQAALTAFLSGYGVSVAPDSTLESVTLDFVALSGAPFSLTDFRVSD